MADDDQRKSGGNRKKVSESDALLSSTSSAAGARGSGFSSRTPSYQGDDVDVDDDGNLRRGLSIDDDEGSSSSSIVPSSSPLTLGGIFRSRAAMLAVATLASLVMMYAGAAVQRRIDSRGGGEFAAASATATTTPGKDGGTPCKGGDDEGGGIEALRGESYLELSGGVRHGAVAADHPLCSRMGLSVLERGGNAVDAAVATALCLGVANPASSGMGGGAFILIHADPPPPDKNSSSSSGTVPSFHDAREPPESTVHHKSASGKITEVVDCREVAPGKASEDMYEGLPPLASVRGGLAVGVPGELRGLELAHSRHGKLPWRDVVQPAADLAQKGVEVNANLAHEISIEARKYRMAKNRDGPDYGLRGILTHDGSWDNPLLEGQVLKNEALAETLAAVRDRGADALYRGPRAEQLAADVQAAGGILTADDVEAYQATLRSPVVAHDVSGFSIVGVPPPSSGGAAIIGAARFLAGYESPLATFPETLSRHRAVEALKHAFAIRMSLSDPAFDAETNRNATADLTTGTYMEELRRASFDTQCLPLSQYGGARWAQLKDSDGTKAAEDASEGDRRRQRRLHHHAGGRRFGNLNDHGTSHLVVVDKDGNAVSMTSSVNTYFGSNVVSKTGVVLSNTMDDFSNPGRPNYFGLHPSEANFVAPYKKPLSSMSPTMVFRRHKRAGTNTLGELMLVLGASGGPKIISAVSSVIANYVLLGMPLYEAVVRPRLHDQLIYHGSAVTTVEDSVLPQGPVINVTQETRDALIRRGHALLDVDYEGTVQAVAIRQEDHTMSAACDVRKGGSPAGS